MIEHVFHNRQINKDSPLPYYHQIAQELRGAMEDLRGAGEDDGEVALPSEPALAEIFEVTRGTVRHALEILEREGLVVREKGRGTFMKRRRVELDLTELGSITEHMTQHGWEPSYRLLGVEEIYPLPRAREALDIGEGETVWAIHRLRLANGEPVSVEESYIPRMTAPDLGSQDLGGSLYDLLQTRYGLKLGAAEQTIRTRQADSEEAVLLTINEGEPVFSITGTIKDADDTPVEYARSVWRGDRYDLQVRLVKRD